MHLSLLLVISCCLPMCAALPYNKEPQCYSKYDFEEKILEKVLRMELWVENMKTRVDTDLDKAAKDIDFTHEFGDMKRELSDKLNDVDTNVKVLEDKANSKLQELDIQVTDKMEQVDTNVKTLEEKADSKLQELDTHITDKLEQVDTKVNTLEDKTDSKLQEVDKRVADRMKQVDNMVYTLEGKADSKLQEVQEQADEAIREMKQTHNSSIKPDVAFLAKDVKGQPSSNQVIKFTSTLENVGDGYSLTSGCFTAPINGTYWFSAQICTNTKKAARPSIVIRGTLTARAYVKDQYTADAASVHAVSVLKVGDTVCLETGAISSSAIYNHESSCFGNFMGALVN